MNSIGDIVKFDGTGEFEKGIECVVMEISPEDGRITKMKAVIPDERLIRFGFIIEGEDYVAIEWNYSPN